MTVLVRLVLLVCALAAPPAFAAAQAAPSPSPSPSPSSSPSAGGTAPSPSPTPRVLGLHAASQFSVVGVDRAANGEGLVGPEAILPGQNFVTGAPLSPNTPYDLFSSAPLVPGVAGIAQLTTALTATTRRFDVGLVLNAGYVRGSVTNASYWSENLPPQLNPHLGSQALPYTIAFPTHAGQDDGTAFRASVLAGSVATADGALRLRAGWFDLAQTNPFVFTPPPLTSVNPSIAYAPAESLASGPPDAEFWPASPTALPLHGVDLVATRGLATLEATAAALPSLPGEDARLRSVSVAVDHGEGTRYTAQLVHATTGGLAFLTTVPFGADPAFTPTPQGVLPTSTLSGQRQTIVGAGAAGHLAPALGIDGVLELARSWYDASPAARPGTSGPGTYAHLGLQAKRGRATASVDAYRMEPRFATMILPYGVAENQWSAAFAWPGQWLKSNYQLVANNVLGVNRQGYRLRYAVLGGAFELRSEYTSLRQIDPETRETSTQTGFVDGYYLPQVTDAATFGKQQRSALWLAWHPAFGDLTLDLVDDTLYRPWAAAHPEDRVSYEVPQAVATFSRRLGGGAVAAVGLGRYAIAGSFAEPIDLAQRLAFAGVRLREGARAGLSLTLRRTTTSGITTYPASPRSPNFTSEALIVEQRVAF